MTPSPHRIASLLAAAGSAAVLGGCGSPDPLATTCEEFLALGTNEQTQLIAIWASPDRREPDPTQVTDLPFYRAELGRFCAGDPARPLERIAFDPATGAVGV